eukprot:symbB.v1.2.016470.t1/scaffold1252.1/size200744/18
MDAIATLLGTKPCDFRGIPSQEIKQKRWHTFESLHAWERQLAHLRPRLGRNCVHLLLHREDHKESASASPAHVFCKMGGLSGLARDRLHSVLARRIADALIYVADDPVVYLSGARQLSLFIMRYHELMWCSPHQSLELQLMLPGNSVQLDNQKMCCIF